MKLPQPRWTVVVMFLKGTSLSEDHICSAASLDIYAAYIH